MLFVVWTREGGCRGQALEPRGGGGSGGGSGSSERVGGPLAWLASLSTPRAS